MTFKPDRHGRARPGHRRLSRWPFKRRPRAMPGTTIVQSPGGANPPGQLGREPLTLRRAAGQRDHEFCTDRHRRGPRIGPSDRGGDQSHAAGRRPVSALPHPRPDRLPRLEPSRRPHRRRCRRRRHRGVPVALERPRFRDRDGASGLVAVLSGAARARRTATARWNGIPSAACSPGSPPPRRSRSSRRASSRPGATTPTFHANAREVAQALVNLQFPQGGSETLDAEMREGVVDWIARLIPFLSAQGFTIALALYLYTAGQDRLVVEAASAPLAGHRQAADAARSRPAC